MNVFILIFPIYVQLISYLQYNLSTVFIYLFMGHFIELYNSTSVLFHLLIKRNYVIFRQFHMFNNSF